MDTNRFEVTIFSCNVVFIHFSTAYSRLHTNAVVNYLEPYFRNQLTVLVIRYAIY